MARNPQAYDAKLAGCLAAGATFGDAAEECGISERTVKRAMSDEAFRRQVLDIRTGMVARASGILAAALPDACFFLAHVVQDKHQSIGQRMRASGMIAKLFTAVRDLTDNDERMAAIEARLDALDTEEGDVIDAPVRRLA